MMKQQLWKVPLLTLMVLGLMGCGKDDKGPTPDPPPLGNGGGDGVTAENVSYTNFIGALLQSKCSSCHAGAGPGTVKWVFSGYSSVKDNLARINDMVIVRKLMPQTGSLSTREMELLKAWIEKDGPQ